MKNISELYHDRTAHKWYDYPVKGGHHESSRGNNGQPFPVYHRTGAYTLAYGFGEK